MSTPDLGPYQVTTNWWQRATGRRWAYVIHKPGWWPHTSHYRYRSEASAQAAGERDAAESWAFEQLLDAHERGEHAEPLWDCPDCLP